MSDEQHTALTAVSPLDGRYAKRTAPLTEVVSEFALHRYRVRVEVEWFVHLAALPEISELSVNPGSESRLRRIWQEFDHADAHAVRDLEAGTNHDVKAVEYFVKDAIARTDKTLAASIEFVHFACTSEDINNVAYALMMQEARDAVLGPSMDRLIDALADFAAPFAEQPMLARTHGQAASPTTVGKELANFVVRLRRQREQFHATGILAKLNGAVGNYNAHVLAYPQVDWPARNREFIARMGLDFNEHTTQIEPHDYLAELFHSLVRFNQVVLDFDRDIWGYIALGYFRQRPVAGETGSSTMPHKVNPIDFENSEGNVGLANAVLGHLAEKLPVSRWQRDLSDSTALRSVGTAFGHCVVAWESACRGIAKLDVDRARLAADLDGSWEVLAEAVQTVLRASGGHQPYERLKELTRGRRLDRDVYRAMLDELDLPAALRDRLAALTPAEYTGLATRLARSALERGG